jgi:hypothetical protein
VSLLRLHNWHERDIPAPQFLLGQILSTTARLQVTAPTGLGKTHFVMALGLAVAGGTAFLHWAASEGPHRVLFIDGEMSRRLLKRRLEDAVRRHGDEPDTFYVLSREDFPQLEPVNSEAGQRFIDQVIDALGGLDLIVFDNVQSLTVGDLKEEETWQQTLNWARDLTRREIGQLWVHHTGLDETHGYGSKTREWQLDTVALLERIERPDADFAFLLKFTKARERAPENRADFDDAIITLTGDEWSSERQGLARRQAKDRMLELLNDEISRRGFIPKPSPYIPPNKLCVTETGWRQRCESGSISEGSKDASDKAFRRGAKALLEAGKIGKEGPLVWAVK